MIARETRIEEAVESQWDAYSSDEYNEICRQRKTYKMMGSLFDLLIHKHLITETEFEEIIKSIKEDYVQI